MATNNYLYTAPSQTNLKNSANNKAQNIYDNALNGYNDLIADYRRQLGNLSDDKSITDKANHLYGDLKYGAVFNGLNQEERTANVNYENTKQDLNKAYTTGLNDVYNTSFRQRQEGLNNIFSRGLGNSSVVDNRLKSIDKSETSGVVSLASNLTDNITKIDRELNATLQGIQENRTLYSKNQQAEIVDYINEKTKEREQEKQRLNMLIGQTNADIILEGKNKVQNSSNFYNEDLKYYQSQARTDRDYQASEREREFQRQLAEKQYQLQQYNAQTSRMSASNSSNSKANDTKLKEYEKQILELQKQLALLGTGTNKNTGTGAKTGGNLALPSTKTVATGISSMIPGVGGAMSSILGNVAQGATNAYRYVQSKK